MLQIYGRADSINVRKVLWLCDEIGLAYERHDYGRGFTPTNSPEFLKLNPLALIPVIDDEGFFVRDSNTILRYLAAKNGRADLYPNEINARSQIEAWMDWAAIDLYAGLRAVFLGHHLGLPAFNDPAVIENGRTMLVATMELLDKFLADAGPYLNGTQFSLADIPAGVIVNRWFAIDFEKPELSSVAAYHARLSERSPYMTHVRNGLA